MTIHFFASSNFDATCIAYRKVIAYDIIFYKIRQSFITVLMSEMVTMDYNLTSSFITEAYPTTEPYTSPFDATGIVVSATILITFLVVGVLANVLMIAVVMTYSELYQSVFMRFIVSLCISDLMSALISWLFLYRRTWGFDFWNIPSFFCQLYWATDLMTSYVTALHIFSFAVLRYISVQFPLTHHKITIKHGNIWIASIWALCFVFGFIPFATIFGARPRDRHSSATDSAWPACTVLVEKIDAYSTYQLVAYPIFLILPAVGVVVFCLLVAFTVKSRSRQLKLQTNQQKRRLKKEKQAVIQLLLIIVSFLIGYIPFIAYEYWAVQVTRTWTTSLRRFDYWFGMVEYFFLRFSECLNPFFYNLGSIKMRKYTLAFVKRKICCLCWKLRKQTAAERQRARWSASSDGLRTTGSNLGV